MDELAAGWHVSTDKGESRHCTLCTGSAEPELGSAWSAVHRSADYKLPGLPLGPFLSPPASQTGIRPLDVSVGFWE